MIASIKRTAAACEGEEEGERRLLTVEEVTQLARRTQEFERYREYEAELEQELGREPSDAELAARLGMAGGAREYRERLSACRRAKHTLVQSNLRLVYSVAGRFTNRGLPFQVRLRVRRVRRVRVRVTLTLTLTLTLKLTLTPTAASPSRTWCRRVAWACCYP